MLGRVAALVGLLSLCGVARPSWANGRAPQTTSVTTSPGGATYLGATFGLLVSTDDDCSFRWICEQNIGFAGTFDPKYAVDRQGTIYATTFSGLRVSRDGGCTFVTATEEQVKGTPGRIADLWVDAIDVGPSDEVWVATAESGLPNDIYRSTDRALTFAPMGLLSSEIWWKSIQVAPSRAERVYVTGYQIASNPTVGPSLPRTHLRISDDGGASWTASPLTNVAFGATPQVVVLAVDAGDPDRLWLRSIGAQPPVGDRVYRSDDGGQTFVEVVATGGPVTDLVVRADGSVWVATVAATWRSPDGNAAFAPVLDQPQLACLQERADGTLLGCGANWEPDFLSLGHSQDGTSWRKRFRFSELAGPVRCPAGTPQHDVCEVEVWPGLQAQFGAVAPACAGGEGAPVDAGLAVDAGGGGGGGTGCCQADRASVPWGTVVALLLFVGIRRRRRA